MQGTWCIIARETESWRGQSNTVSTELNMLISGLSGNFNGNKIILMGVNINLHVLKN